MDKLAKAMQGWPRFYLSSTGQHAIEYLETGDPAALARIRPSKSWEHWPDRLRPLMADPGAMGDEDRRALHAMAAVGSFDQVGLWLSLALGRARGEEDFHDLVRPELATVKVPKPMVAAMTVAHVTNLHRDGRPNSAGRYLLSLSDAELEAAVKKVGSMSRVYGDLHATSLAGFLLATAPERLEPLLDLMLDAKSITPALAEVILKHGADRYEEALADAWRKLERPSDRLEIGRVLAGYDPGRYGREMLEVARAALADRKGTAFHDDAAIWIVQNHGDEVLDEIVAYLLRTATSKEWTDLYNVRQILPAAAKALGPRAIPAVLAALRTRHAIVHRDALAQLIELDDGAHADRIQSELTRGLSGTGDLQASGFGSHEEGPLAYVTLAGRWKPSRMADQLWELLRHKQKAVRDASARALGRIGPEVVPQAAGMLTDRKADVRAAAVTLLATAGTAEALRALESRLDEETDEDIRDAMLLALDAGGREVTREEIDRRIARTAPRLKKPVADWLDESKLPPLRDREGDPLGPGATRYLLYRQSRAREIWPDVEARPLYDRIDRSSSGAFALAVLRQFLGSKVEARDRWALAVAGLLGDDRIVPTLHPMIQSWAESSRGKMAEYAVQALALLGTDAALMCADATATRYRAKNKNVGAAAQEAFAATAERLGLTVDELGDRVVPRLGFEPGRPRVVDAGGKRIEVAIGPDFKLRYRDPEKNKAIASLPRSLPKETLDEFKATGATLREVARAQKLRLENLMVRQFRWPLARWRELFLDHPVLFLPFATRLVWGHYDEAGALWGTFRALEDRTLTDAADEPSELPEAGTVGIVHPLELDEDRIAAWRTHLADYEVEPPFPQLERPVIRAGDGQREVRISKELAGTSVNALTFRGRAEKLGWARGSVGDGGSVESYRKVFPGAGVEAFVGVDGLYMGIGPDQTVQLGEFYFVKAGTVAVGSYLWDNPRDEDDARLIPFGEVPPVVFSEVVGDLRRIAGKTAEEEPGEE